MTLQRSSYSLLVASCLCSQNESCRSLADVEFELWNTVDRVRTTSTVDSFTAKIHPGHECRIETGKIQLSNMIMNTDLRLVDESATVGDYQLSAVLQFFRLILVPWNEDVSLDRVVELEACHVGADGRTTGSLDRHDAGP